MDTKARPSAHDVAGELRRQAPFAGAMQIHKWLYYCQGWHLALTHRLLFSEPIEAWANGPVVGSLWRAEMSGEGRPDPQPLGSDARATVDFVMRRYGRLSAKEMIRLTHNEKPWMDASESDLHDEVISLEAMEKFFMEESLELDQLRTMARAARYGETPQAQALLRELDETMRRPGKEILTGDQLAERYGIAR